MYALPRLLLLILALFAFAHCNPPVPAATSSMQAKGKLFIIGGGPRPTPMLQELLQVSGLDTGGYAYVLPMASEVPDTAAYYAQKQFIDLGIAPDRIKRFTFSANDIEALPEAQLIYITGGDQVRFMQSIEGNKVEEALHQAWLGGTTIAGTSAGAAVMSARMITGNEYRYPEYTGEFRSIECDNIEIGRGLGFLENAIIDQHFIYRMRLNRLIAVALENPGTNCYGIDESTALIVEGDSARVVGEAQVIRLAFPGKQSKTQHSLIGGQNLKLDVLLPGEKIAL